MRAGRRCSNSPASTRCRSAALQHLRRRPRRGQRPRLRRVRLHLPRSITVGNNSPRRPTLHPPPPPRAAPLFNPSTTELTSPRGDGLLYPGLSPAVALFRSLGDPARLAIVSRWPGEARVVDLTRLLGLAQSTVSKHLACLRDCQPGRVPREGRQSYYCLTRPELVDLLRSAELLLAETGVRSRCAPSTASRRSRWKSGHDLRVCRARSASRAASTDPTSGRGDDHLQRRRGRRGDRGRNDRVVGGADRVRARLGDRGRLRRRRRLAVLGSDPSDANG